MKQVYIAQHPTDAHFVAGLLETQGIDCRVRGETLFSVRGEVPMTEETAPSVWILDATRLEEALEVVADYQKALSREAQDIKSWRCDGCGEQLEEQFTSCWNCGRAREISENQ